MSGVPELNRGKSRRATDGATLLTSVGWLARVPADMQAALLSAAVWYDAKPGTDFIHAGDDTGGMFGIARGVAEVSFLNEHPDTPAVHIVRGGFWAGYRPLLGRSRNLTVKARTDVLWALVPQAAMDRMLAQTPIWWRWLMELCEDNVETVSWGLADLTLQDSTKRAAAVLLRLAGCRTSDPPPHERIDVQISQVELAAMAVMSRNTMNRVMQALAATDAVEVAYRSIRVRNPAALRAMLED